jgi:hypothetical protein
MSGAPHAPFYSPEEITAIADRIYVRVEANRTLTLTPFDGMAGGRAVRAYSSWPTRERLMQIICGKRGCNYATCMICMGKANAIMNL